jgi:DNA-binding MurR/RpiR family transcriptional regulator
MPRPKKPVTPSGGSIALEDRILERFTEMTRKQQGIARVILEEDIDVAWTSAAAIGARVGADATTVVRFAQLLGYGGWVQLRNAVREELPRRLTASEKLADVNESAPLEKAVLEVMDRDVRNVQETIIVTSPAIISQAVEALAAAHAVFVVALGMEIWLADNLAMQLARTGLPVRSVTQAHVGGALELTSLEDGDVVVGLAIRRYTRDTNRMLRSAKDAGATCITITDSKLAPIVGNADIALVGIDASPVLPHSMTGLLSIINAVATGVTLLRAEEARSYVANLDALLHAWDVFDQTP